MICKNCGNEDLKRMIIEIGSTHKKLSCGSCGKYIKFVSKEEVAMVRFAGGVIVEKS